MNINKVVFPPKCYTINNRGLVADSNSDTVYLESMTNIEQGEESGDHFDTVNGVNNEIFEENCIDVNLKSSHINRTYNRCEEKLLREIATSTFGEPSAKQDEALDIVTIEKYLKIVIFFLHRYF